MVPIDRAEDPRLDDYRNVPDRELRVSRGVFLAEGRLVVHRLLESGRMTTRSVMVTAATLESMRDVLDEQSSVPVYLVPQAVMNGVTGIDMHRGCLAVGERPTPLAVDTLTRKAHRLLVVERVANADNVGGLFRNAAAFGVDAVVLDQDSTDPLYRKAIRTSMAATLQVPFARDDQWPASLAVLKAAGFRVVGLTLADAALPLRDAGPALRDRRVALVVGHEGDGLTAAAVAACDVQVRIPMAPGIDSLNVATAAAVALHELT